MEIKTHSIVHHKLYGYGEIKKIIDNKMYVSFGGHQRIFIYPDAFEKGYLSIDAVIEKPTTNPISSKSAVSSERIVEPKEIIMDAAANISYGTIYEAINATVGTNYTGWMKACWPNGSPDQSFRIWFVKLAETKNGKLVPAANNCLNTITSDWNEVVYDNLKMSDLPGDYKPFYDGYSLIYAKEPQGGPYVFRGVFIPDVEKSHPNHHVSKRIGTRVKMIGKPAYDIEILDDFRNR